MDSLRIGIAGAGVGGLAAASLLVDLGHRVRLFDQFDAPGPVGSGLILQPVGLQVLDRIGAGRGARELGAGIARMQGLDCRSGRTALDVAYGAEPGQRGLAIHRAALFSVLHDAATRRRIPIEGGRRIRGRSGARFSFEDGEQSEPFDLLIDASGARSSLSPLRARPLSYGALWGVVDWVSGTALPADRLSQRYRGAERMIGVLPIGRVPGDAGAKAAVFWSLRSDGHDAWRTAGLQAWKEEAFGLWPTALPFFDQIADCGQMTMARYSHGTLRRPFEEGLAIIGDAAHRASPQLGQGANMALLDAAALALALEHVPGREDLPDALRLYAAARRWHVRAYQAMSALFTPQYQSDSRWLPVLRDRVLYPLSCVPPLPGILSALVSGRLLPPLGRLGSMPRARLPRSVPEGAGEPGPSLSALQDAPAD